MRIGYENLTGLQGADVAWITEWQLATAFPWVPIGEESPVRAEPEPEPGGRTWRVHIRVGQRTVDASLPARDLRHVAEWCYRATERDLAAPPPRIRGSLVALRSALRRDLAAFDPLDSMGYRPQVPFDPGDGETER